MSKLKMGIIGFGNMGTTHARNLKKGLVKDMELGAICDIDPNKLDEAKKLYPEVPLFDRAEKLYKDGNCDVVIIAIPHYDHPKYAEMAFEYGLNVITEKPAGVYTKQVIEMNEAAKKSGKLFGIMYNQRTTDVYKKIKKMVEEGQLGHIKRIQWTITTWYRPQAYHDSASWRSSWAKEGGGTLINQNPHQLDLWQWMFGMPDRITSHVSYGKYYNIEVEDDVTAYMEYNNGTTGVYITSTGETPGTNRLEIAADMGKIVVEDDNMIFYRNTISEREFNKINTQLFGKPECWKCEIPSIPASETPHALIMQNFAESLLNGTPLIAPGYEGINGLTISNAIHLSSWTGETVDVKNFPHDKFYELLKEKIAHSNADKKVVKKQTADTSGSY
ncbi:MAG: Gfo/Idh/MocA family oxidoreductase [Clostridia bacterium]|nr:Gfo/Idh/MocA family oxidoreductase [Clostridia bacterium]